MNEFDVQPELMNATLTPQEGSTNIDKAKVVNVEPDAFIDNKDLNENYESVKRQISTTAPVARKLSESRSVASVMKDEVPQWNTIDKTIRDIGNSISNVVPESFKIHANNRRISQLYSEQIDRSLTDQEKYELRRLEGRVKRYQKENPGLSEGATTGQFIQGLGETAIGALLDIPLSVKDNPGLAATTIGVPAAVGTVRGIPGGIPGALVGGVAAGTAAAVAPTGLPLIQAVDQFKIIRGDVVKDLGQATDPRGVPLNIPVNIQRQYANGAAVVGSMFEIIGFSKLLGNVPIVKRLGKKAFAKIATSAAGEAAGKTIAASATERSVGKLMGTIGKAMAIEGGQEGFQELTQQIFTSGGLSYNAITKDADLSTGISNLWDQYKASANTLLKEGKLTGKARDLAISITAGAVAGPVVQGGLTVATEVPVKVAKTVGERRKARADQMRTKMSEDLNNRILNRLAGMQMPMEGMPRQFRGAQGQQAQVVIEELVKLTDATELKKLQPGHANQLIADIAQDSGVPFVWMDPDDARQFSTDEQKAADIRKMFGADQEVAASKDTQVKIKLNDALDFVKKYPETSGMFAFSPGALTANEAVRRTEELKAKQQEILNKVSKEPTTPRPSVEGLVSAEQAQSRLSEQQAILEDLKARGATDQEIQNQEQIVRDIEARAEVLPSEATDQMTMDFADQLAMKKAREAQDIDLPLNATQEQVDAALDSREQAEAYWDRLDREEARLVTGNDTERLQQIQELKSKVEFTIASKPSEVEAITQLQGDIATNEDMFGVQRYNEQSVIPPELALKMNQSQVAAIEGMAKEANKQYTDAIMDAALIEWTGVVNEQERIALTVEREIELENLRNNPEIDVVENFLNSKKLDANARELLGATKSKSKPGFAIDPESLTVAERDRYLNDPTLNERGVFDKKGMSLADAAELAGAKNGNDLLRILSEVPTRQQAVDRAVEERSAEIRGRIESATDFNTTAIAKTLNDKSMAAKNALEFFKNGDWSGFKKAIKAVVLPMPRVEDIRARAEKAARQTRISDLSVGQFKKGELRSKRKAADAVLRGELQEAFEYKTNEIENIEAARATHKTIGEVNKRTTKVAKFFLPETKAILQAAGQKYVDAIEDIMSSFNLSPYVTGQQKQGAYEALAKDMANKGQGDIALPEHVVADFDPRMGWDSLTAEQYIEIVDLMDNVLALARQKKRTIESYTGAMQGSLLSLTEAAALRNLADHPDRNINRAEQDAPNTILESVSETLGELEALVTNTNFAVQQLDRGQTDGFWHKLIVERLKGIGNFSGTYGTEARSRMYSQVRSQFSSIIKKYGSLKFSNLGAERITVKQFEGIPGLYNGNMRKLDLVVLALNMGNQGNIDRVSNFNVSEEVVWDALNEHLTTEEMDIAQGIWDIYASLEDRVVALEKLDGDDVELVPAKSFTFQGKTYRGGYAPIQFVTNTHESLLGRVKNTISDMFKKKEEGYSANDAARGMTARGYIEKRVGSDQRISLDVRTIALGLDEVITDLAMRVPVRDTYKILTNYNISREIMAVIGKPRYKAMIDGVSSLTTSETARRLNGQIQGEATLDNFFSNIESAEAVTALAANVSSIMMQPLSIGTALENMGGIGSAKHVANVVAKTAAPWNWHRVRKMYQLAEEINPSIKNAKENIESRNAAGISDLLPTRRNWGGKPVNMLSLARKSTINTMMGAFALADVMIKTPVTLAAYEQYMKGEAPGQDPYALYQMSPEEKHRAAVSYAQKVSESALTHTDEFNKANIQKTSLGKRFARYFNDLRNQLNTTLMSVRQLKWNFREAGKLAKEGDVEGSAKAYHSIADRTLSMILVSVTMGVYETLFKSYGSEDDDELSPEAVVWSASKSRLLGAAPLVREITFSVETGMAPGIPITRAAGNIASGVSGLGVILNNYTGLINDTDMDKELTAKQTKGMWSTLSYMVGGLPVNGPWKLVKAVNEPEATNVGPEKIALDILGYFIGTAENFIEKYKDDPKMEPITEAIQKDLNVVKVVSNEPYEISEIDLAAFRKAENPKGQWDATNPNSTAFGDYQITEGTWLDIVNRAPKSLMLTPDGLYDKDGKQAEKGIKWLISDNARQLQQNGIEPTLENIYGAHHFGANGWMKVLAAKDSASIESTFSKKAIESNEWLTEVNNAGEAKAFINRYITKSKYAALRESRKRSVVNNP